MLNVKMSCHKINVCPEPLDTDIIVMTEALEADACVQNKDVGNNKDQTCINMISPTKEHHRLSWKQVFYDWTKSTTCHGVNKITEPTQFPVRRLVC